MDKIVTVSIIGCGSRGVNTYGSIMQKMPDKFKIVALCDINEEKLEIAKNIFNVDSNNCFLNPIDFFKEKRSDLLIIATLDTDHFIPSMEGCRLGYKILLEKPISSSLDELHKLSEQAKKYNTLIMVCHVLRYTWSNKTLMEIINSNRLGKLIQIDHSEQIAYWHFAHSYVRGNWRNLKVSAPMIMAKSCHDLDLLQEYANSKVLSLSSYGDLNLFKKENKPEGAASRCLDCKYKEECPYSAYWKYIMEWEELGKPQCWPFNVISNKVLTKEVITDSLRKGPYGRCVFECDNDVVDNQTVAIKFENGVQATFKVSAFTKDCGRITILNFTYGQVVYEESKGTIIERPFNKKDIVYKYNIEDEYGHGGGDVGLVNYLYKVLTDTSCSVTTSLENSIESHLMAIAAEDSRLNGGKVVYLKDYR